MRNKERDQKIDAVNTQIKFCSSLLMRLDRDFNATVKAQDEDPYDNWRAINLHTRYANDARRIRRELLALVKMLEDGE